MKENCKIRDELAVMMLRGFADRIESGEVSLVNWRFDISKLPENLQMTCEFLLDNEASEGAAPE